MSEHHTPLTLTFQQAESLARAEAKRILQLDREAVRYVKYDPKFFHDYCRVDIVFDGEGNGPIAFSMLPITDRLADEALTDEIVRKVAQLGKLLDAIRLYRLLHSADLATAKKAVERMLAPD